MKQMSISIMFIQAKEKLSLLAAKFTWINKVVKPLFTLSVMFGYLTHREKERIQLAIHQLKEHLQMIDNMFDQLPQHLPWGTMNPFYMSQYFFHADSHVNHFLIPIISYLHFISRIKKIIKQMQKLAKLHHNDQADYLATMIKSLGHSQGKTYTTTGDTIISTIQHGKSIDVNLSATIRIYLKGLQIYAEKKRILKQVEMAYHHVYALDFQDRRRKLLAAIDELEEIRISISLY